MSSTPKVLVLYATRHGHTQRIAEFMADALRTCGCNPDVRKANRREAPRLSAYDAAILASPIHITRHAKSIVRFIRDQRPALERMPSLFVTVSMTQRTLDDPATTEAQKQQARTGLAAVMEKFVRRTGWQPARHISVAGRLAYTHYDWVTRWVMRRIARAEGGSTDTSRDHVYTDWQTLRQSVAAFGTEVATATAGGQRADAGS